MGGTFGFDSGTSMACPIVAGLAARYLEFNPNLRYFEIVDIIYFSRSRGFTAAVDPPVRFLQRPQFRHSHFSAIWIG